MPLPRGTSGIDMVVTSLLASELCHSRLTTYNQFLSRYLICYPPLLRVVPLLVLDVHEEILVRVQRIPRISNAFHCCLQPRLLRFWVNALQGHPSLLDLIDLNEELRNEAK